MVPVLIAGGARSRARAGQVGFGVRWTVQVPPFQRSAMVWFCVVPTVVQAVADVQETLAGSTEDSSPGGTGGTGRRRIVHRVPSQRSAMPETPSL